MRCAGMPSAAAPIEGVEARCPGEAQQSVLRLSQRVRWSTDTWTPLLYTGDEDTDGGPLAWYLALDLQLTGLRWQRSQFAKQASHLQSERSNARMRSAYERARNKSFKGAMRGDQDTAEQSGWVVVSAALPPSGRKHGSSARCCSFPLDTQGSEHVPILFQRGGKERWTRRVR